MRTLSASKLNIKYGLGVDPLKLAFNGNLFIC